MRLLLLRKYEPVGVTGDHQILLGWDHPHGAGALWCADRIGRGLVSLRIKTNPKKLQTATRFPAHGRRSLPDSSGEHQGIEAAQRRRQCSDGLAQLITEQFHRLSGMWVACPLVEQGLHVRA